MKVKYLDLKLQSNLYTTAVGKTQNIYKYTIVDIYF